MKNGIKQDMLMSLSDYIILPFSHKISFKMINSHFTTANFFEITDKTNETTRITP